MNPSLSLAVAETVTGVPTAITSDALGVVSATVGAVPTAAATLRVNVTESNVVVPSLARARATSEYAPGAAVIVTGRL